MPEEQIEIQSLMAALDSNTAQLGAFHPETVAIVNNLAIAFWGAGETHQAIGLLDQALGGLEVSADPEHPVRVDLLCTLGEIMRELEQWAQAGSIYRDVLDYCVRPYGANHSSSLAANGDLAAALFEVGEEAEAVRVETQACENARVHLGKSHSVTCVLAWNRALRLESRGDTDSARKIVLSELAWLLIEDDAGLGDDQQAIRAMLAKRVNWNAAAAVV